LVEVEPGHLGNDPERDDTSGKEDLPPRGGAHNKRGIEALGSVWSFLDLTPWGRQETWEYPRRLAADSAL
jgi:predicted dithiol-disulfide oxidoreductase (DUF899 family)